MRFSFFRKWKKEINASGLDLNLYTLKFNDYELEKQFCNHYFDKSIFTLRLGLLISMLLFACFGLLDKVSAPKFYQEFYMIRFAIVTPSIFVFYLFTFLKNYRKFYQKLNSTILIICGTSIIYMLHRQPLNIYYYGGVFLIFMGGYFYIKLRFTQAVFSGISLILIYFVSSFAFPNNFDLPGNVLANGIAFFAASNVICMVGLYDVEYYKRADFYQKYRLSEKQKEIEKINERLEYKVMQRTSLLDDRNSKLEDEIEGRKSVERRLRDSKYKAEESERLKTAFLANMSHEIRTPMNGILGFTELLKSPNLSGDQQELYIDIIKKSGERMLSTVNDIIEVSKIETGQVDACIRIVDINAPIKEVYGFFNLEAEAKGLSLKYMLALEKEDAIIQTDGDMFYSILSNLVKNAIKFTEKGTVLFGYDLENDFLKFYVKDTGFGISQDRQAAIFNRFEQADIEDRNARQGSGLGLSIAKAYTELLGGEIWLESELNKGTVFYFTIPYKMAKQKYFAERVEAQVSENMRGKSLLIVEDEDLIYEYYKEALLDSGLKLHWCKDGVEAVDYCSSDKEIDLVLMDMKMPRMDGYEATRKLKELHPKLKIIAQTAYALSNEKEKIMATGCDDYLTKPVDNKKLIDTICRNLK